jgi:hypothetical protein
MASLRGAKRRSNPARAKRAKQKHESAANSAHFFGAQLERFASLAMT